MDKSCIEKTFAWNGYQLTGNLLIYFDKKIMCLNSERIAVDSLLFSNEEHLVYYKGFLIGIVIKFEKLTVTRNFQQIF